jgi:hypothetical protein
MGKGNWERVPQMCNVSEGKREEGVGGCSVRGVGRSGRGVWSRLQIYKLKKQGREVVNKQ